jgi:hypothetical protein
MNIIAFGHVLADFETRLETLENAIAASIEAVKLETNAIMNAVDNAATTHIQDLQAQLELVQSLRGRPDNVTELRANNK